MVEESDLGSGCLKVLVAEECCGSLVVVVVQNYSHCCYVYAESPVPGPENVLEISRR